MKAPHASDSSCLEAVRYLDVRARIARSDGAVPRREALIGLQGDQKSSALMTFPWVTPRALRVKARIDQILRCSY